MAKGDANVRLTAMGMGVAAPPVGGTVITSKELTEALKEQATANRSRDVAWQGRARLRVEKAQRRLTRDLEQAKLDEAKTKE